MQETVVLDKARVFWKPGIAKAIPQTIGSFPEEKTKTRIELSPYVSGGDSIGETFANQTMRNDGSDQAFRRLTPWLGALGKHRPNVVRAFEPNIGIGRNEKIAGLLQIGPYGEQTDDIGTIGSDMPFQPENAKVFCGEDFSIDLTFSCLHLDEPHFPVSHPACQASPPKNWHGMFIHNSDGSAMEERMFSTRNAEGEKVRAVLKKAPLFGEEEREAGEVDLLVVSLDLSEVRV